MNVLRVLRRYGDVVLAGVLACVITTELVVLDPVELRTSVLLGLAATLPLALRRRAPLVALPVVMAALHLLDEVNRDELHRDIANDSMVFVVAYLLIIYSVGRHAAGPGAWLGAVGVGAVMVAFWVTDGSDLGDAAYVIAFVGSPYAAGLTLRLRREREAFLQARNEQLRAQQQELARRAVAEERSRIARELHDVVSHAISVTVLQARGARRQLETSPEEVRRALDAIEATNTAALGDMRRLLAVLRDTEDAGTAGSDGRHPLPSLARLDELARRITESGVPVRVETVGAATPLPPGVDLSAYRIVQEALTNVLRHAGPASATVSLDYLPDALVVRVRDTGTGGHDGPGGRGLGLVGIRERVAVVGGEMTAGRTPGGGFQVAARLPLALETP